jgi:hypothetical protein
MIRSLLAAAAVALVSLSAPQTQAQAKPTPDMTPFEIPTVLAASEGFGSQLVMACEQVKKYKAPAVGAPAAAPAAAPPLPKFAATDASTARAALENASAPTSVEEAALDAAALNLKVICAELGSDNLVNLDSHLEILRELRSSGIVPAIAAAAANGAKDGKELIEKGRTAGGPLQSVAPVAGSSLTGVESSLFNGLASFLVTRSKEEAILYLQEKLGDELCDEQKLSEVFPNTCALVTSVDGSLSLAAMGTALNAAAKADLRQLPDGLLKLAELEDAPHYYGYEGTRLAFAMILHMADGREPLDVLRSVHALPARACEDSSLVHPADAACRQVFRAFRLSSGLLYAGEANGFKDARANFGNVSVVGTLLDAEARANSAVPKVTPPFALQAAHYQVLLKALKTVAKVRKEIDERTQPLTKPAAEKADPIERRRQLASIATSTMKHVAQLTIDIAPSLSLPQPQHDEVVKAMNVVAATSGLATNVLLEQFGAAILDGQKLIKALSVLNPPSEIASSLAAAQKLLPLVAEIASAKNSADVATALEAAAAPASSYRAKYERSVVAIGGLVGGLGGWEKPSDPSNTEALGNSKSSGFVGGFAPVGLQAAVPLSTSLYLEGMLSVIDLGALTTQRFEAEVSDDEDATTTTNVTFGQVFSPGLYVMLGLCGSPLVLGGGVSMAPSLRKVSAPGMDGTVSEELSTVRVGGFLAMDVTILPL